MIAAAEGHEGLSDEPAYGRLWRSVHYRPITACLRHRQNHSVEPVPACQESRSRGPSPCWLFPLPSSTEFQPETGRSREKNWKKLHEHSGFFIGAPGIGEEIR